MDTVVFNSGNSQAVRIPKEFRLKSKVVSILKKGNELIIKEKTAASWDDIYNMKCDCEFDIQRENDAAQTRELF